MQETVEQCFIQSKIGKLSKITFEYNIPKYFNWIPFFQYESNLEKARKIALSVVCFKFSSCLIP